MPVFIFEPEALNRMAEIEGQDWYEEQLHDTSEYSFNHFKKVWQNIDAECPKYKEYKPAFYITDSGGNCAIYGKNGWNRYLVKNSGELVFKKSMAYSDKDIEKAEQAGFTIW